MKFDEAQPIIEKMLSAPSDYNLLFSQREALKSALAEVERLRAELAQEKTEHQESLEYWWKTTNDAYPWFAKSVLDAQHFRDQVAAMREIVQALADGPADSSTYLCNYCDEYIGGIFGHTMHTPDCPVTKARAILEK